MPIAPDDHNYISAAEWFTLTESVRPSPRVAEQVRQVRSTEEAFTTEGTIRMNMLPRTEDARRRLAESITSSVQRQRVYTEEEYEAHRPRYYPTAEDIDSQHIQYVRATFPNNSEAYSAAYASFVEHQQGHVNRPHMAVFKRGDKVIVTVPGSLNTLIATVTGTRLSTDQRKVLYSLAARIHGTIFHTTELFISNDYVLGASCEACNAGIDLKLVGTRNGKRMLCKNHAAQEGAAV